MKFVHRSVYVLFVTALLCYAATFFFEQRLIDIDTVSPASLKEPVQTPIENPEKFTFEKDGASFMVSPLFNYKISGIVVNIYDFSSGENNMDKGIPFDLCVVYGDMVKNRLYLSPKIRFSHFARMCEWRISSSIDGLNDREITNNHLVVKDDSILNELKTVKLGDEVVIKGKLVNVSFKEKGYYSPIDWNTSTTRDDKNDGSGPLETTCETIYVDSIEINTAHKIDSAINEYSLWVLVAALTIFIVRIITYIINTKPPASFAANDNYKRTIPKYK